MACNTMGIVKNEPSARFQYLITSLEKNGLGIVWFGEINGNSNGFISSYKFDANKFLVAILSAYPKKNQLE